MSSESGLFTRDKGSKTVIMVDSQNVDYRNCDAIKATVAQIIREGKKDVVLNLERVTFMDSSGLGVLLFCKRSCDEARGTFVLCNLQGYVNNLVQLTKLNKAIQIFDSEENALAFQK